MEAYLQTGRAELIVERDAAGCEGHFVAHPDAVSAPRVVPASPEEGFYSFPGLRRTEMRETNMFRRLQISAGRN